MPRITRRHSNSIYNRLTQQPRKKYKLCDKLQAIKLREAGKTLKQIKNWFKEHQELEIEESTLCSWCSKMNVITPPAKPKSPSSRSVTLSPSETAAVGDADAGTNSDTDNSDAVTYFRPVRNSSQE